MDNWHFAMYCVGVFVTCNVGGALLGRVQDAVSAALMKRHGSADASGYDENARYWPTDLAENRRRFDEIQRQTAHPDADADPEGGDAS